MKELHGIPASQGIAIGPVIQFKRQELHIERTTITDTAVEWARFQAAVDQGRQQLDVVYQRALAESGAEDAAIFEAHAMMLDDPELSAAVQTAIEQDRINAEAALSTAAEQIAQMLESLDDEYLSARTLDVRDVADRVLRILCGVDDSPTANLTVPSIILADDLTPSDTVVLDKTLVLGFCIAAGGATSHTAILARGLGIPAVVGAGKEVLAIPEMTQVIIDGGDGLVLIAPDEDVTAVYQTRQAAANRLLREAQAQAHETAVTQDGHAIEIVANIGSVADAESALAAGAEGVGLLRSEFLYLERTQLPDEEEQYQAYRAITMAFGDLPVILRTLDVGGDKELPYLDLPPEANPFLGVRALRLCFARPDLFKPQLRAALRAGAGKNLKVMFPMVATVDEVRRARALLNACRDELVAEGQAVAKDMEIGIMIEIPAAALMADQLAREVDFFSIGTNDLAQYTMAADRTNAEVAPLASGFEPAVLRLIQNVIEAAHAAGKWVGLCGELAGEPLAIPILLGLGLDEFSMNPPAIPPAKQLVRSLTMTQARKLAAKALTLESGTAVQNWIRSQLPSRTKCK